MLEMYVLKHKDEKCGLVSIETGTGVVSRIHVPSPAEGLLRVEFGEGMMIIPLSPQTADLWQHQNTDDP